MSVQSSNSLERMGEGQLAQALDDALGSAKGDARLICAIFKHPAMIKFLATIYESYLDDEGPEDFAASAAVLFYAGWKAREALMESEQLKRMVR